MPEELDRELLQFLQRWAKGGLPTFFGYDSVQKAFVLPVISGLTGATHPRPCCHPPAGARSS